MLAVGVEWLENDRLKLSLVLEAPSFLGNELVLDEFDLLLENFSEAWHSL